MKILVTGGAGYIGSHVVLELCDSGFEVIVFDDLSLGFRENVDQRAELLIGSTLNKKNLDDVFSQNIDAVVHLAAWKAAGESMEDPHKYAQNNIIGTLNVLNSMTKHGVKKFILSSTAAVYGYPEYLPIDEHHPVEPVNYYGYTKLVIEQNLKWFSELKGARYASLRYFNAAGYDLGGDDLQVGVGIRGGGVSVPDAADHGGSVGWGGAEIARRDGHVLAYGGVEGARIGGLC